MEKFLQLLFSGVALGWYALLALGFVVVFKATQVVNFAHAGLLMVGTYCTARFSRRAPVRRGGAPRHRRDRGAGARDRAGVRAPGVRRSVVAVAIMTIGVDVVLQTEITRRLGIDILPVGDPWQSLDGRRRRHCAHRPGSPPWSWRSSSSPASSPGRASPTGGRGAGERRGPPHRRADGVRLGRVSAIVWVIAVLAVLAGVFLGVPSPGVSPTTSAAAPGVPGRHPRRPRLHGRRPGGRPAHRPRRDADTGLPGPALVPRAGFPSSCPTW